jgi:hypothetical protein
MITRLRVTPQSKRSKNLALAVTEDHKKLFEETAKAHGMTFSAWAYNILQACFEVKGQFNEGRIAGLSLAKMYAINHPEVVAMIESEIKKSCQ